MEKTTSTIFKTRVNIEDSVESIPAGKQSQAINAPQEVEPPLTNFSDVNGKPYTVEHYKLSNLWDDPQGGFENEVSTIETYLKHKVELGEIANTISAAQKELKRIEKLNNLHGDERIAIKLGTLAAYTKFLLETDNIKVNARKYGNY